MSCGVLEAVQLREHVALAMGGVTAQLQGCILAMTHLHLHVWVALCVPIGSALPA